MKLQKLIWTLCFVSVGQIYAKDSYPAFCMKKNDIHAVLKKVTTLPLKLTVDLPADISFVVADVKYDNGKLKFCECGDGIYMSFRTAQVRLNNNVQHVVSPYWGIFWNYLAQFNLPIWLIGNAHQAEAMAVEELKKVGGCALKNLSQLEEQTSFKKQCCSEFAPSSKISNYKGIIVFRAHKEGEREGKKYKEFQRKHPEFLYVNATARKHFKRKDRTYRLFSEANLTQYIPRFKIYPAIYSDTLAEQIAADLDTNMFVLKPPFNSLSNGVNAVDNQGLDSLLRLILKDKNKIAPRSHRSLAYWRRTNEKNIVATEYVPSRTIVKDGKLYDPTMRIVFMMHQDNNTLSITPITGFWKIPVKSLNDKDATLTDKHITIAHAGAYYSGILVDKDDWNSVEQTLKDILPELYLTMLELELEKV